MVLKKMNILLITAFLIGCCVCACGKEDSITSETLEKDTEEVSSTEETKSAEEEATEQWEKGYNLPVDEQEAVEAENDCIEMMERISDIYGDADKGAASNVVLEDETIFKMQKKIKENYLYNDTSIIFVINRLLFCKELSDVLCGNGDFYYCIDLDYLVSI